jgi:hypothetical protein
MENFSCFEKRFFVSPHVVLSTHTEGNTVLYRGHGLQKNGYYHHADQGDYENPVAMVFGCRAGPWDNVKHENLSHEMAHFVEIDEPRCGMYGWGLRVPKVVILGQEYEEPHTNQATIRECRTVAIQANLMHGMGRKFDEADFARSLQFMPDWCYVPDGKRKDYQKSKEYQHNWCVRKIRTYMKKPEYSFEAFQQVWFDRIQRLPEIWASKAFKKLDKAA